MNDAIGRERDALPAILLKLDILPALAIPKNGLRAGRAPRNVASKDLRQFFAAYGLVLPSSLHYVTPDKLQFALPRKEPADMDAEPVRIFPLIFQPLLYFLAFCPCGKPSFAGSCCSSFLLPLPELALH